jgi:hypothetical protein
MEEREKIWKLRNELLKLGQPIVIPAKEVEEYYPLQTASEKLRTDIYIYPIFA